MASYSPIATFLHVKRLWQRVAVVFGALFLLVANSVWLVLWWRFVTSPQDIFKVSRIYQS